ncbi:hypothetical protein K439DRAFT_1621905 [Ramaria rubella]|nr:hypothetical protein K439DRAFT_1621905 [Ramaria rubella]
MRSSISVVPIETEWEHVTSVLSHIKGDVKLTFPTFSQGVVFGTIAIDSTKAGSQQLPKIEGLSLPKKGVSSNRNSSQSASKAGWRESFFANENSKCCTVVTRKLHVLSS